MGMVTSLGRSAAVGAAAGVVATIGMSAVMVGAERFGGIVQQPPQQITSGAMAQTEAGRRVPTGQRRVIGWLNHFLFGAAAGALFAVTRGRAGHSVPGPLHGIGFGGLVWIVSYAGWIPALGLLPSPPRDRTARQAWMVLAHGVYGAILGALTGAAGRTAPRR